MRKILFFISTLLIFSFIFVTVSYAQCKSQGESCSSVTECCDHYVPTGSSQCYHSRQCSSYPMVGDPVVCWYYTCSIPCVSGIETIKLTGTCTSTGCSASTAVCSAASHTNCQSVYCYGRYYCTYDGSTWRWRTSYPTEAGHCSDGVDNDCDGKTDSADSDCTVCGNSIVETGEVCDPPGTTDPGNSCRECSSDCKSWVNKADGTSCPNDGNLCTSDTCQTGSCTHQNKASGTSCGTCKQCDGSGNCVNRANGYNDCDVGCQRCVSGNCLDYDQACLGTDTSCYCSGDNCVQCSSGRICSSYTCILITTTTSTTTTTPTTGTTTSISTTSTTTTTTTTPTTGTTTSISTTSTTTTTTTTTTTPTTTTTIIAPFCGNGVIEPGEQCERDTDCSLCYQNCNAICQCYDFRPETSGCNYYDNCNKCDMGGDCPDPYDSCYNDYCWNAPRATCIDETALCHVMIVGCGSS